MKNNFKVGDTVCTTIDITLSSGQKIPKYSVFEVTMIHFDGFRDFVTVKSGHNYHKFCQDYLRIVTKTYESTASHNQVNVRIGDTVLINSDIDHPPMTYGLCRVDKIQDGYLIMSPVNNDMMYPPHLSPSEVTLSTLVTLDDIAMLSFPLHNEDQTHTNETLEKSPEDPVKLHENKLREEVKQHREEIEKDTRGAYQFFLNNEDDIIYKLKMSNRPTNKRELIKYHQSIFPKLDEKLFGRMLLRKGYIFSTPRDKYGQPFGVIDWIFWFVIILLVCMLVLASLVVIL